MFFRNQHAAYFPDGVHYMKYHPYWVKDASGNRVRNAKFDLFSGRCLDLKENQAPAVELFRGFLDAILLEGIAIAAVPSHDPAKIDSGIKSLARVLCSAGTRTDATSCLVRTTLIEKLAGGGNRSIQVHLNSIVVENVELIAGRAVLLLDDVTTSGNSLLACEQLLLRAGATIVQRFAIGKTERD